MDIEKIALKYQIIKSKHKTEEGEIISEFVTLINKERENTKYKKVSYMAVRSRLLALKGTRELREFLSVCKDYKNRHGSISKIFYGATKLNK